MSSVRLEPRAQTCADVGNLRIDAGCLAPDRITALDAHELARLTVNVGRERCAE